MLGLWGVLTLSTRRIVERLAVWVRVGVWWLVFSLPLITLPAATAALTYTVWVALRDPFDERTNIRQTFRIGFYRYGMKAFWIALLNGVALTVIGFGISFWLTQPNPTFYPVAGVAAAFLIPYALIQPLWFPALIQQSTPSIKGAWATVRGWLGRAPLYVAGIALLTYSLTLAGVLLLGPLLLVIMPFLALIILQSVLDIDGQLEAHTQPPDEL